MKTGRLGFKAVTIGYRRWISFAGMMSAVMLCFAVGTTFAQIEWRLSAIILGSLCVVRRPIASKIF
jgi:hypothetical protein